MAASRCTGANTADRGPTATRRSPRRSARHASARSPSERPEWSTATWSPNTPRTRATVWGVSAISGTSRIAPGPGQPEAVHEVADRRRAAQRLERLVAHAPLGRAPERPLALEQRGKRLRQHEHPFRLLRRPRRTLHAPQRPGEQRPQRQAEGRTVIRADPAAELDQRAAQGGL